MWMSLLLLVFPSFLYSWDYLTVSDFECPGICVCSIKTIRCNRATERSLPVAQRDAYRRLTLTHLSLSSIASHTFEGLSGVLRIEISQSISLETIETVAFNSLLNLSELSIQNTKSLAHISRRAFNNLPKLRYLSISNTGISQFPDLAAISSLEPNFILDICDNLKLQSIPPNSFLGMTEEHTDMNLYNNGFTEIQEHAFNGTKIDKLVLKNNRNLRVIHSSAFKGAIGPSVLDVSSTALEVLPPRGLDLLLVLVAQRAYALKTLPPVTGLGYLQEAHLTYPSHCCSLLHSLSQRKVPFSAGWINGSAFCKDVRLLERTVALSVDLSDVPPLREFPAVSDTGTSEEDLEAYGGTEFQYPELDFCHSIRTIQCTPEADAFNPCEDIAGFGFLRVAIWFITVLAIMGNLTVLLVFICSHCKWSVPRFLMCHLAFADLCIGVYLLMIATVDLRTRGSYSQHAIEWQTGPGCSAAGFLTVFGSELSIYTLTMVTLERWHTITHALQLERRLCLAHAAWIMAVGWLLCLGVALLPLVGVSSYRKVSVCLPMDIDSPIAQVFVILLLLFNVAAFCIICACYVAIYLAVRNPGFVHRNEDAKIAKRMAVLIFTDFTCMAPISFFAISAAFKMPLITVTNSKILLVLFYPINSCANPFLYAIFTKGFRRDTCALLGALGCCERTVSRYHMHERCHDNTTGKRANSPGVAPRGPHTAVHMYIVRQPDLTGNTVENAD